MTAASRHRPFPLPRDASASVLPSELVVDVDILPDARHARKEARRNDLPRHTLVSAPSRHTVAAA
jgi:hypothetical protein